MNSKPKKNKNKKATKGDFSILWIQSRKKKRKKKRKEKKNRAPKVTYRPMNSKPQKRKEKKKKPTKVDFPSHESISSIHLWCYDQDLKYRDILMIYIPAQ